MDPERELQLAEVARIKKEELKKKKLAESERNEQKSREERLAFLEDIKKCQEEKGTRILLAYFLWNFILTREHRLTSEFDIFFGTIR